ncbi:hypothetical protein [Tissierella pigra]|uniref:Uncharacterized protein n=1 Tax=Tissierella pigra TaxID=2607614 RepID=A0A6N7XKS2_9FIRM|nr:hypothetical protein [Tissierella pigra]MSU01382.1 hypothetical protein [Tissierella pigra]
MNYEDRMIIMGEMATKIEDKLKAILRLRTSISYTSSSFEVCLYSSDYDYYKLNLKYTDELTSDNYAYIAIEAFRDALLGKDEKGYVTFYKASTIEKFIQELIKEYKAEDLIYIRDGELWGDFENQYIPVEYIKDVHYNEEEGILAIVEYDLDERYRYEINFKNSTVEQVDINERLSVLRGNC